MLETEEEINQQLPIDIEQIESKLKNSLIHQVSQLEINKKELVDLLDKPQRDYQNYLKQLKEWGIDFEKLCGNVENPVEGTLNWFSQELKKINSEYLLDLGSKRLEREEITKKIFKKKIELISFYDSIKKPIDKEIGNHNKDLGDYNVSIESGFRFDPLFYNDFFNYINQQVRGSFQGIDEGSVVIKKLCENVNNLQKEDTIVPFLNSIIEL